MNLPNTGQDVLFWQEPITDTVPRNMRLLLDSNHRQTKIVVQEYTAYTNLLKLISSEQASCGFPLASCIHLPVRIISKIKHLS